MEFWCLFLSVGNLISAFEGYLRMSRSEVSVSCIYFLVDSY